MMSAVVGLMETCASFLRIRLFQPSIQTATFALEDYLQRSEYIQTSCLGFETARWVHSEVIVIESARGIAQDEFGRL